MKIWIDGCAFENTRQRGIWRVFYEFIERSKHVMDYTLWLRSPARQPLPSGVRVFEDRGRTVSARFDLLARSRRRRDSRRWPSEAANVDLFHSTGFTLPTPRDQRTMITVYDMIAERWFPLCIEGVEQSIEIKSTALHRSVLLPCISTTTASELSAFYPELSEKVRLFPLGCDHLNRSGSIKPSEPFVLFVGQRGGYKNFLTLLDALQSPQWPNAIKLRVVGSPFTQAELLLLRRLRLTDRIEHIGRLSDEELEAQYERAVCLVFPSFAEGFGLPCVEAQRLGCPLVCSDIPVFHEVAGKAALFFDPRLGEQLASRVAEACVPEIRQRLIESGMANAEQYTWQAAADRMCVIYRDALTR